MAKYRNRTRRSSWGKFEERKQYAGRALFESRELDAAVRKYFQNTDADLWYAPELTKEDQDNKVYDFIKLYGNSQAVTGTSKKTSLGTLKKTKNDEKIKNFIDTINRYIDAGYADPAALYKPVGVEEKSLGEFANEYRIERQLGNRDIFKTVGEYKDTLDDQDAKSFFIDWSKGVVKYGDKSMPVNMYDFSKSLKDNFENFIGIDDDEFDDVPISSEPIDIKMYRRSEKKAKQLIINIDDIM